MKSLFWNDSRRHLSRKEDLSSLCPKHGTHALKYCPDVRPHLERQREREAQARRDLAARFKGLQRCLTCNDYFDPRKEDHSHQPEEEE